MTWLFIRFYAGVLLVLLAAWMIYGVVLDRRSSADLARVVVKAHAGGARLLANELNNAARDDRTSVLAQLEGDFDYPLSIVAITKLPNSLRRSLENGSQEVAYWEDENSVVSILSGRDEVIQLGRFPGAGVEYIEKSLGGWMRLVAIKVKGAQEADRNLTLEQLNAEFEIPITVAERLSLTQETRQLLQQRDVVFFQASSGQYFSTIPISDEQVLQFGPFPSFQESDRPAATTTLALVLLPAALAIALLLRPVARQLRRVEEAAKAIAKGDLSARVDERKVTSVKQLAHSFNHMAGRTETLVRTQRELLQAVSHELRTPLSRMRFAIDLIDSAKDDDERRQRLESLDASTEELDQLVGELLSYVRMETAPQQFDPELIDLKDALESTIPKFAGLYPNIQFEQSQGLAELTVFADRVGFHRALGNLIGNAGRFAKTRVLIHAQSVNGKTTIDVDDDGPGIPADDRQRVFEPFLRLENNASEASRGTGLGLALVQRIVARNGGSVVALASSSGGCRMRTVWPNTESRQTQSN